MLDKFEKAKILLASTEHALSTTSSTKHYEWSYSFCQICLVTMKGYDDTPGKMSRFNTLMRMIWMIFNLINPTNYNTTINEWVKLK